MANLVGRKKNQGIQNSPLMKPKPKINIEKSPPVPNANTYLENAATEKSRESLEDRATPRAPAESSMELAEASPRVSKTKDMLRKHMFYTAEQLDRTGKLADVLMQKKSRARSEGSPRVKTSEIITRNTFIRASVDAVLTLFDDEEVEMVDNEAELRSVMLGRIRKAK